MRWNSASIVAFCLLWTPSCCREAPAQIRLSEVKTAQIGGIDNPRIVNGIVVGDASSKPFIAKTDTQFLLLVEDGYTLKDLEVETVPGLEFVSPTLTQLDGNRLELKLDTTGKFRARAELDYGGKRVIQRFNFSIGEPVKPPPKPDDPLPPPVPNDDIRNEYGLGLVAYQTAPDAAASKAIAKVYRAAGDSLYAQNGQPLRSIATDNPSDNANPNRNVIAWLNQQLANAKSEFRAAVKTAFAESQTRRQYTRGDWFAAFNEIADALDKVK